jgi:hypothetical protein
MAEYLILSDPRGGRAILTTEASGSSYGIPVLVVEADDIQGEFGPADLIVDPAQPERAVRGADLVAAWALAPERTPEEREAARRYLGQWPAGPQIPGESRRRGAGKSRPAPRPPGARDS